MSDMVVYINIIQFFNDNVNKNSAKKHEKRSNLLTAAFKPCLEFCEILSYIFNLFAAFIFYDIAYG